MELTTGFQLRFLGFFGPQSAPAILEFGSGLNVLYGASDTGKSFVVETIDFMLGGKPPLRGITERLGYDCVLLGLEGLAGEEFTLQRSADGGNFLLFEGLHKQPPGPNVESKVLSELHSDRNEANLSSFLLAKSGLTGKRIRKNARNETNSLSFRNIARLVIVTETEITQQRSPLLDGNYTADTANTSTFKLLLTNVDDSALVSTAARAPEELSREAQLKLLDQLLDDFRDRLKGLAKHPEELTSQLEKIEASLRQHSAQLNATEAAFQEAATRRRELRKKLEKGRDRRNDIAGLIERFNLLDRHYISDIERLQAIEEGGTLLRILGTATCPLCGSEAAHQRSNAACEGNTDAVVEAARKEISKIEILRSDLAATVSDLAREGASFDRYLPPVIQELELISSSVESLLSPKLAKLRATYSEFSDKRVEVREALGLYATVQEIEGRRKALDDLQDDGARAQTTVGDAPTAVTDAFAQSVQAILQEWHFPEAGRVSFDPKARDLVIEGKPRGAHGKGLRAITHAAFTLGLLSYCRTNGTAHPGFVILDSPLLAYREPDGIEDDLRGTDLKEQFYRYLQSLPDDQQVIIVENTDPPDAIKALSQVLMFSKNPHSGRYGLFPYDERLTSA
jgi:hypothetical protein